jgi:hypothetical protein
MSLPGVSATPGTRIILPVELRSLGGSVAGVQFDLQYDGAAMSIAATAGDAVSNSGKSLYHADLAPNKRRFLVVGLNQNPIPSGTLINLLVYLNSNASSGSYPLIFSNIVATDRYGLAEPTTGVDGAIIEARANRRPHAHSTPLQALAQQLPHARGDGKTGQWHVLPSLVPTRGTPTVDPVGLIRSDLACGRAVRDEARRALGDGLETQSLGVLALRIDECAARAIRGAELLRGDHLRNDPPGRGGGATVGNA